jgi:hypothetical protein
MSNHVKKKAVLAVLPESRTNRPQQYRTTGIDLPLSKTQHLKGLNSGPRVDVDPLLLELFKNE